MSKGVTMKQPSILRASALASFIALGMPPAMAQQVHDLGPNLQSVPPDLIQPGVAVAGAPAPNVSPYTQNDADLGDDLQDRDSSGASVAAPARISRVDAAISQAATPPVKDQPGNAAKADKSIRKPAASYESTRHGTERALFERAPVAVPLPVGVERLITLPAPAALHVPSDMDKVTRLEVIDRTIYATAKVPFTPLRVIAELIDSGQQIPLDLVANAGTASARSELEVFVVEPSNTKSSTSGTGPAAQAAAGASAANAQDSLTDQMAEAPPSDMVQLTRYAARQLYAPKRLTTPISGVQQVDVASEPLQDLFRGAHVLATPVGQWRSGLLYVTAVLVNNRSRFALEVPLEQVRGKWIAATAQHGRIGPEGTDTDTTAVYLVCERRFEACR